MYTGNRPSISERGAIKRDPIPNVIRNMAVPPSVSTTSETWKSSAAWTAIAESMELAQVTMKAMAVRMYVVARRRFVDQFLGS